MNAQIADPSSLPDWMIIFAFAASLVLTLLKIGEWILGAIRKWRINKVSATRI